jgi:trypsin-like peptidase
VAESSARLLEQVIAVSMPAVVMIETDTARGSGFFVTANRIMTNHHVVAESTFVSVTTQSGTKVVGRVTQRSDSVDVAVIEIDSPAAIDAPLPLGESAALRLGQSVISLGWARSLEQRSVTRGIVTGLRRVLDRPFLQIDAAPYPGDSGGPVLNRAGEVVGITTLRANDGGAGYAVPIDDAKPVLADEVQHASRPPNVPAALVASTADTERAAGTTRFTSALEDAAGRAADLDTAWSQYKRACRITSTPEGLSHEWFRLYDARSPLHQTAPQCASALAAIEEGARAIDATVRAAEELARRADVFPGTRRDVRRRLRVDFAGWDR